LPLLLNTTKKGNGFGFDPSGSVGPVSFGKPFDKLKAVGVSNGSGH